MQHKPLTIALLAGMLLLAGCAGPSTNLATTPSQPGALPNPYAAPSSSTSIYGSGATFPKPLIEAWAIGYANDHPSVQVSYAGGGSGKGITDITAKSVQFAGSDAPLQLGEKASAPGILQFPETIGPVAVVHNVEGGNELRLTGDVIGQIMVGAIKKWNDPAIASLNPGLSLPGNTIVVVYRSDSSGTTYAFTDFLTKSSKAWTDAMGASPSKKPTWTSSSAQQLSGNGNDGVGSLVKSTPNSIGYVDLAYVKSLHLDAAAVKNPAGEFVAPTTDGAAKAASSFANTLPSPDGDWSKVSIVNAPGEGAYPISSFSYILVYDSLSAYGGKATASQMNGLKAWLWWCLHDGQSYATTLGYAPLPPEVVKVGEKALQSIQT